MKENINSEKLRETNPHTELCLKNRKSLLIDGVVNIEAFDKDYLVLELCEGKITVEGEDLKIISLCQESGKIEIEGTPESIFYSQKGGLKQSIFGRRK